jgi:hypothetical protein
MNTFRLSIYLSITFILIVNLSFGQNFSKLKQSTDSSYGYSVNNPLKLRKGDPLGGVSNANKFLLGLQTADGQELTIVSRIGVNDPNYKEKPGGIASNLGDGGILDKYELLTSVTKTKIILYVDIYHKGGLMLPVGLKYVSP